MGIQRQEDPAEGSRDTVEHELERQDGKRGNDARKGQASDDRRDGERAAPGRQTHGDQPGRHAP